MAVPAMLHRLAGAGVGRVTLANGAILADCAGDQRGNIVKVEGFSARYQALSIQALDELLVPK